MIDVAHTRWLLLGLALVACGRGGASGNGKGTTGAASAAPVASGSATVSSAPPSSDAGPPVSADTAPPTATFLGASTEKSCKATTITLATYQQRGDVALGGNASSVAATWRVHLVGKPQEQVAFAAFDAEGKQVAKTRGVGGTVQDIQPRVFVSSASQWTVAWFDAKGLAYSRPKAETLPIPDVLHLGAVPPEVVADVALSPSPAGAVLATTPLGAGKAQLVLFLFAGDNDLAMVKALGTTHHAKEPHRPAVAATEAGTFVAWDEGGALVATHFDPTGKEGAAPCTIAPASAEKRDRFALAAAGTGAIASWVEGARVRTRAIDASGCPVSPVWDVGEGRWASLTSFGDTALVAWVAPNGHVLATRLAANGGPAAKGIDAAEGSTGAKDPPAALAFGNGKLAFGWAETMGPAIKTNRILLRIIDAACVP